MNDAFPDLVTTTVRYIRWDAAEAIPAVRFPGHLFRDQEGNRVASYLDALEVVFRQMNRVDGKEFISRKNLKVPSLSVGDTVSFDSITMGVRHFVCEGCGWAEISEFDRDWLVEHVTHRDFWGTFAKTVEE